MVNYHRCNGTTVRERKREKIIFLEKQDLKKSWSIPALFCLPVLAGRTFLFLVGAENGGYVCLKIKKPISAGTEIGAQEILVSPTKPLAYLLYMQTHVVCKF